MTAQPGRDGNVTKLPVRYHRESQLPAASIHAIEEPTDFMVWEVCPYLRNGERCQQCARIEHDDHYGDIIRGCRAMAEEACKVVLAARDTGRQS